MFCVHKIWLSGKGLVFKFYKLGTDIHLDKLAHTTQTHTRTLYVLTHAHTFIYVYKAEKLSIMPITHLELLASTESLSFVLLANVLVSGTVHPKASIWIPDHLVQIASRPLKCNL